MKIDSFPSLSGKRDSSSCESTLNPLSGREFSTHGAKPFVIEQPRESRRLTGKFMGVMEGIKN